MNHLFFDVDNNNSTVCWENNKDKYIWLLLSHLWLLDKYKDNKKIVDSIFCNINRKINRCKHEYGDKTYDKIMEKALYGVLNKSEGEKEMKKMLIGGLVMALLLGATACGSDDDKDNKVVAPEFWGTFGNISSTHIITTEKEVTFSGIIGHTGGTYPAWTKPSHLRPEETSLWYRSNGEDELLGNFTDEDTFAIRPSGPFYNRVKE